jgi:nitroreductase
MPTITNHDFIERLNWRYAVKKFDPTRTILPAAWSTIEETLILSPSSYGLQPYRFLIIEDPELRRRLAGAAYGQPQVTDSSHLVVFAVRRGIGHAYVERFIGRIAEVRKVPAESLTGYQHAIVRDLIDGPRHRWIDEWSARQTYIALGNALTAAALLGIDSCPMEGFEPDKFDEILGLSARGFASVVLCAFGHRHPDDKHAHEAKVRFSREDLIEHR